LDYFSLFWLEKTMKVLMFLLLNSLFQNNIKIIDPENFLELSKDRIVVIDVRTPAEHNLGHIENAVNISIADIDFIKKIEKLAKNNIYVIYCRSGNRSSIATKQMSDMGFINLYHLNVGYLGWKKYINSKQ